MKLIKQPNQNIWFTSDTHYGHSNICRATTNWQNAENITRDFKSLDHMNSAIVDQINGNVKEDDILFHLGDVSFGGLDNLREFRSRVLCKNIHLILGNHDQHIEKNISDVQRLFLSVSPYMHLDFRMYNGSNQKKLIVQQDFILMHYPIQSWDGMNRSAIHLHGHVHLPPVKRIGKGKMMDVGVDGNGLAPISILEVMQIMAKQPIASNLPFDHHIERVT
jgi:calcineurin-like phosphoesterase family protein